MLHDDIAGVVGSDRTRANFLEAVVRCLCQDSCLFAIDAVHVRSHECTHMQTIYYISAFA